MKRYVIYHKSCYDGFCAAWCFWQKFGTEAEYIAKNYGDPLPYIQEGAEVYVVDVSWPYDVMMELYNRAGSLVVLDHHDTAKEPLKRLAANQGEDLSVVFSDHHSGAYLAWSFLRGNYENYPPPSFDLDGRAPYIVQYVEDRDLWLHRLDNTHEINSYMRTLPFEFEAWDDIAEMLQWEARDIVARGEAVLAMTNAEVSKICEKARLTRIAGREVPIVNATNFMSEVGHKLLELYPDAPFSVSYRDIRDETMNEGELAEVCVRTYSLRGRGEYHVGKLAESIREEYAACFSGGGHKNAAGCGFRLAQPKDRIE